GFGRSLDLANPALPNSSGQNWLSSANLGGTPGRANSAATNNLAPLIQDVTHFPPVPHATDPIAITARVRDELSNGVANVTLFYRNHTSTGPGGFSSTNMLDNEVIPDTMPVIRLVLSGTERALFPPGDRNSDAAPNCTLISSDGDGLKIRYLCDTRIRGAGTRTRTPPNNRIDIPGDTPWNG